jgi:hypothetical protein
MMKTSYILVLPLALSACSGDALDVGQDSLTTIGTGGSSGTGGSGGTAGRSHTAGSGGTAGSSTTGAPLPDWTDLGECPTTGLDAPQFIGTWEGAVEDLSLQPVVPLRLVITKATSDGVCGAVSWGTTTTPPLPLTDPEQSGAAYGFGGSTGAPVPGLDYTVHRGAARDSSLRFAVPAFEHWQAFCEAQSEPHHDPDSGGYTCTEPYTNMTYAGEGSDTCAIATAQGSIVLPLKQCNCELVCACNGDGCAAIIDQPIDFDLALDRSSGGEDILVSGRTPSAIQSIRLTRVP